MLGAGGRTRVLTMGLAGLAVLDESAEYATLLPGAAEMPEVTGLLLEIRFFLAMKINSLPEALRTVCSVIGLRPSGHNPLLSLFGKDGSILGVKCRPAMTVV